MRVSGPNRKFRLSRAMQERDMSQWLRVIAITISLTAPVHLSLGDEHATLTGKVVDAAGKPIEHATVLI